MKFIVIDDNVGHLIQFKLELNAAYSGSFNSISNNGKIAEELTGEYIEFDMEKIETFVKNFKDEISDDTIILIDLALDQIETTMFNIGKAKDAEIKNAPKLIREIKKESPKANIVVMSVYNQGHPGDPADYSNFLPTIKNEKWFKDIKYLNNGDVMGTSYYRWVRETFDRMISGKE